MHVTPRDLIDYLGGILPPARQAEFDSATADSNSPVSLALREMSAARRRPKRFRTAELSTAETVIDGSLRPITPEPSLLSGDKPLAVHFDQKDPRVLAMANAETRTDQPSTVIQEYLDALVRPAVKAALNQVIAQSPFTDPTAMKVTVEDALAAIWPLSALTLAQQHALWRFAATIVCDDTLRMEPPSSGGQQRGSVAETMLYDTIEGSMYHILTGPDAKDFLSGFDAREDATRRKLARTIALRFLKTYRLETERARVYWPIIADVIRRLLRRWAMATQPGSPVSESGKIEWVEDRGYLYPKMENPDEWIALDDRWVACQSQDPMPARIFALRTYAGLGTGAIANLMGLTKSEVAREHILFQAKLNCEVP